MALYILTSGGTPNIVDELLYVDELLPIATMIHENKIPSMTRLYLYEVVEDVPLKAKQIVADINGIPYKYQMIKDNITIYLENGSVIFQGAYVIDQTEIRRLMNDAINVTIPLFKSEEHTQEETESIMEIVMNTNKLPFQELIDLDSIIFDSLILMK